MSRMSIHYREPDHKPPGRGWGPWRVFVWTLLFVSLGLWAWTIITG